MLSKRAQRLKPSPTLALNARAQELAKSGRDIVSLAVGEPDWDTFENIKVATIEALNKGFTKYTPASGIPELRKAIVDRLKIDHGLSYEVSQCMIGLGAKQTVFNALQVLCDPGDEVIVPAPYWVSYPAMVELADARPIIAVCPKETSFKLTPEILKRSMSSKTKVLILNSPNNPTGQVYSEQELKELASVLELTGIYVISDDIYDKMLFGSEDPKDISQNGLHIAPPSACNIAPHIANFSEKLRPRILLANSLSKTYSMTGWRIGSLVGDVKVIQACSNYQSQSASCAVSFAQKGAVEALTGTQEPMMAAMKVLNQRRQIMIKALSEISMIECIEPVGAFYAFPDISKTFGKKTSAGLLIEDSTLFSAALLDQEGVAVVPGAEFGAEGHVRMSYAISDKRLTDALARFKKFIASLS
jgi:aspartate aminotransferase